MTAPIFRVWCLSWDDSDREGRDVVGYNPGTETAPRQGLAFYICNEDHMAWDAVKLYAEWAHDNRDGHEAAWPLTFRVRKPDGTTEDFEVERAYAVTFTPRTLHHHHRPETP